MKTVQDSNAILIDARKLGDFCFRVLKKAGARPEDARVTAEILTAADLREVSSHGVAQLRRYAEGLRSGLINARPEEKIISETAATALIDADNGLGQAVSARAMRMAVDKARKAGAGFVSVRNSNHHGILAYYAMTALSHDCVGLVLSNASAKVVPTFGRNAALGTNPICVAAPAGRHRPFVLDMATSTAAFGKIENAERQGGSLPLTWAVDPEGKPSKDAAGVADALRHGAGGGLLPLGGAGETSGGHKGYGLAMAVDVFSALLSASLVSPLTYPKTEGGEAGPAGLGHFFGAWRIDSFRPAAEFRRAMDQYIEMLKAAPRAAGEPRIYIPGEKEFEAEEKNSREGIPLAAAVREDLLRLAGELGVKWPGLKE